MENQNSKLNQLKNLVFTNKKVAISLIITLLLLISIPLGVYLAQNPQIFKSRALEKNPLVSLASVPTGATPRFQGYIIEFKDDPLVTTLTKSNKLNQSPSVIESEKKILLSNHETAKKDLFSRLNLNSQQPGQGQTKILGDYTNVFNGVALDITEAQANEAKKSPFVKDVYPNLEVKANLNDSVPLIGADKAWQLKDTRGRNITGAGINVAVLDTGVDYTHADLGASQIPERDFQRITSDSGWHLTTSSDKSKFVFDTFDSEIGAKIYVYSFAGQKLNEFTVPENEKYIAQIVVGGNYLAFFAWGTYGENAGVSIYDLTTGEHKRVENTNVVGTMHIYESTLYYGTGKDSWPESFDVKDVSFTIYNFLTGNIKHLTPAISPTNNYTLMAAFDKSRVAFPVPERDHNLCAKNLYVFDFSDNRGSLYSPPEVGLVVDFKGDEILYVACNSSNFDPTGSSYYLFNSKTGLATKLTYLPSTSQAVLGAERMNGLSTKAQDVSPQSSTFNWNRYNLGLIGDNVVYFKRYFGSSKVIIYNKSQQKYYRFNIAMPIGRFVVRGDMICFNNSGVSCHNYDPNDQYIVPGNTFNKKVIGGYNFIVPDDFPLDDHGHGTHVAATVAGNGILKGVAPEANIEAYKVLEGNGIGFFSTILTAINKAAATRLDADPNNDVSVINMSLGATCWGGYNAGCGPDDPLSRAVDNTADAGIVAVIAAGNSGPGLSTIGSPGTARKAITVGAVDKNKQLADFSSRGPVVVGAERISKPDIVAPGVSICSAEWDSWITSSRCIDDKHIAINGTSMATPHVAGLAVLIKQLHPDWSPLQIKSAIISTAKDLGLPKDSQGAGLVDALDSLSVTTPSSTPTPPIPPPTFTCTPCAADIVKDARNRVDARDYAVLSSCFGKPPSTILSGGRSCASADIKPDGVINQADADCLKSVYFKTCVASSSAALR